VSVILLTPNLTGADGISTVAKGSRDTAPDLSGKTVDGKHIDVADYKGKVVVLNVWGSWCPPCRAETPNLVKVAKETADQGVQFVGINTRDPSTSRARAFEEQQGVPYPSLYDPTGKLMLNLLGSIAQFERELMLERQREGIAKAKAAGAYKGRKPTAMAKADEVTLLAMRPLPEANLVVFLKADATTYGWKIARIRRSTGRAMPSSRSLPRASAGPTCGPTAGRTRSRSRGRSGTSSSASSRRSGPRSARSSRATSWWRRSWSATAPVRTAWPATRPPARTWSATAAPRPTAVRAST